MKAIRFLAQVIASCALLTTAMAQSSGRYPIRLILLKELHSGGTPQGTIVPFMVDQNVTDSNGNVLVKAGTPAYGEVVWSRREGALSALAVYFVWGLFQQYLLNGYFLNRLSIFAKHQSRAPLMTAILFSLAHTPNWFLMLASLAGGYICGWIYFRYRNL